MDTSTGWSSTERADDTFGAEAPVRPDPLASTLSNVPGPGPDDAAYHYRTEREMSLRALARLGPVLRPHADTLPDVDTYFVRATSRQGLGVRVRPHATADALFLDHSDYATLKAGLAVPDLDHAIRTLRAYASRSRRR